MKVLVYALSLAVLLTGCQTAGDGPEVGGAGTGPVTMSISSYESYQRYLKKADPIAFALSADGRTSFYFWCLEFGCDPVRSVRDAMSRCAARAGGVPCYLFDKQGKIVWKQPGEWQPEAYRTTGLLPVADTESKLYKRLQNNSGFNKYKPAQYYKAFAVAWTPSQRILGWGYRTLAPTVEDAIDGAMDYCIVSKKRGSTPCRIAYVNDDYVAGSTVAELKAQAAKFASTTVIPPDQKREMTIQWEDVIENQTVEMVFSTVRRTGWFSFRVPDSQVSCRGTHVFHARNRGVWKFFCTDGVEAYGSFRAADEPSTFEGDGKDESDRRVTVRVGPILDS